MNENKKHAFTVRFTDAEYDDMKTKVKEAGSSQQAFISRAVRDGRISSADEIALLKQISKTFADLELQLRGCSTNINQLAHVANLHGLVSEEAELKTIAKELTEYRKESKELWLLIRSLISPRKPTLH